jgi:hypothetical protein
VKAAVPGRPPAGDTYPLTVDGGTLPGVDVAEVTGSIDGPR